MVIAQYNKHTYVNYDTHTHTFIRIHIEGDVDLKKGIMTALVDEEKFEAWPTGHFASKYLTRLKRVI